MPQDSPIEGAAAVIFDSSGRILLVRENYGRRRWSLPGGAVEPGETPEQTVVRETLEETGVRVGVEHLVGSYPLEHGFTAHAFRCLVVQGEPSVPTTGEIAEVGWSRADEVRIPKSNVLHYALPDAMRGLSNVVRVNLPRVT